jgi:serine/threonine protein kinase
VCIFRGAWEKSSRLNGRLTARTCVAQFVNNDASEFRREAELLYKLCHPNIVEFHGITYDKDRMYIITEVRTTSAHRGSPAGH